MPLSQLRYLRLSYVGFDGRTHRGEMVVDRDYVSDVVAVFHRLYDVRLPIHRMRLVDSYAGDDQRSMAADNTSGFNCRTVAGSTSWSTHTYGAAVDINPVENPDLIEGVAPRAGRAYATVDRTGRTAPAPGVVVSGGPVTRAFAEVGWTWGGRWNSGADYQHFSALD